MPILQRNKPVTIEELAQEIRHLDDRKQSLSLAGTRGFFSELFKEGLPAVALAAGIGAAVGIVGWAVAPFIVEAAAVPTLIGAAKVFAVSTAAITAAAIGAKGALEEIGLSNMVNDDLEKGIKALQSQAVNNGMDEEKARGAKLEAIALKQERTKRPASEQAKHHSTIILKDEAPGVGDSPKPVSSKILTSSTQMLGKIGHELENLTDRTLH